MNTPIPVFVPWLPSQPGTGFDIPINGQRTQFVQTGSLDFSGVTITTNIDYLPATTDVGRADDGTIAAVETQDFLGEVFPCVDAATGDILRVKMYSSALDHRHLAGAAPRGADGLQHLHSLQPVRQLPGLHHVGHERRPDLASIRGAGDGPSRIGDATIFNPTLLTQTQ
jgi:hypothetical protein